MLRRSGRRLPSAAEIWKKQEASRMGRMADVEKTKEQLPVDDLYQRVSGIRGTLRLLLMFLISSNKLRPFKARRVQEKRDWYQTYISCFFLKRDKEKVPLTEEETSSLMSHKMLTWRSLTTTRRDGHAMVLQQIEDSLRAVKNGRIEEHLGFRMVPRTSSLSENTRSYKHGLGLFVEGEAPAGTVLGVYPGMVWLGWQKRMYPRAIDSEGNVVRCSPHVYRHRHNFDNAFLDSDLIQYHDDFRENATDEEMEMYLAEYTRVFGDFMAKYPTYWSNDAKQGMGFQDSVKNAWEPIWWYFFHRLTQNRGRLPYVPRTTYAQRQAGRVLVGRRWDHMFSMVRYINHCGNKKSPNAYILPIVIPATFPKALLPYLPLRLDSAEKYSSEGRLKLAMAGEDPMRAYGDAIISANLKLGTTESPFLQFAPAFVAIASRPIENEEVLVNMRFDRHHVFTRMWPQWYRPSPEGVTEDFLINNRWPDGTSPWLRALGVYDAGATLADVWRDPRLADRDLFYYLSRLAGRS
eukprot:Sspe_Gene.67228::Locus_39689_Transcript_5_5_Confidence_0.375_Length_1709::g.67228::m.67228